VSDEERRGGWEVCAAYAHLSFVRIVLLNDFIDGGEEFLVEFLFNIIIH